MKHFLYLIVFVFHLFLSGQLFAQCPATVPLSISLTPAESTCEANGTITVTITGGTPFTDVMGNSVFSNQIIAGPATSTVQNSTVFTSLPAGDYTIEVTDLCGTSVTSTATVIGTYLQPDLTFTAFGVTCIGGSDGAVVGTATLGLAPYSYRLIDLNVNPIDTSAWQSSGSYANLIEGDYYLQMIDACNNFQSRDVTIINQNNTQFSIWSNFTKLSCDSIDFRFGLTGSPSNSTAGPYDWEITAASEAQHSWLVGMTGSLPALNPPSGSTTVLTINHIDSAQITISMLDRCGNTAVGTFTLPELFARIQGYSWNCTSGSMTVQATNLSWCSNDYEIISGPVIVPPQNTPVFDSLPAGNYCFRVTDCCSATQTFCGNLDASSWDIWLQRGTGCLPHTVDLRVKYINGGAVAYPVTLIMYDSPPNFPGPDTVIVNSSNYSWNEVPEGYYCIRAEDACGYVADYCAEVLDNVNFEPLPPDVQLGCVTGNQLTINYQADFNIPIGLTGPNGVIQPPLYLYNDVFPNLTAGTYIYRIGWSTCTYVIDTIEIPPYIQPDLSASIGVECDDGSALIIADGFGGVPPLQYEIISGPQLAGLQNSPLFSGMPLGTYTLRVVDECNNSDIYSVAVAPFNVVLQGYSQPICVGDTLDISVDSVRSAVYTWTGPNGFTAFQSQISLLNASSLDSGLYTVNIDLAGCTSQTISLQVDVINCLPYVDTDGDGVPNNEDIDDDNDGIPDVVEAGCPPGSVFGSTCPITDPDGDDDGDGVPNYMDPDWAYCGGLNSNGTCINIDLDGDGVPNHHDLDADGDGIPDIIEAGGIDTDYDGQVDYPVPGDPMSMNDPDGDGLSNDPIFDSTGDGIADTPADINPTGPITITSLPIPNTDNTGGPNYLDPDSDGDGIPDSIEITHGTITIIPTGNDTDGDGIDDAYDSDDGTIIGVLDGPAIPLVINDTDGDGTFDYIDLDSDNDGIPDSVENMYALNNGDTDGDGFPDYQDLDSDNDGINDIEEAGGIDADHDALADTPNAEGTLFFPTDTDNDGIPDYLEVDSNNDGITDISGSVNANQDLDGDGVVDNTADPDEDGIPNVVDGQPTNYGDALRGVIGRIKILLEGPYDATSGLMSDNLRATGLIPSEEPYTALGFTHFGGGGESVAPAVLTVIGNDAIVDWIFLELRDAADFSVTIATRSALLQADGDIVDTDGVSSVTFNNIADGNYYVVAKHRNHLAVMTPGSLPMNQSSSYLHDFSTGSAYGLISFGDIQKLVSGGKFALWEADFDHSGSIDAADRSDGWNFRNQTGYLPQDSNFDGVCDAAERSKAWNNRNKISRVP